MARKLTMPRSPFWWVEYRDAVTRKIVRRSTGLRRDGPGKNLRAVEQVIRDHASQEYHSNAPGFRREQKWDSWVPAFLVTRYGETGTESLRRYNGCWKNLALYLKENKIELPRQLTREHCLNYYAWRQQPDPTIGKRRVVRNTARLELKVLRLVLNEALDREFINRNPCTRLESKHDLEKLRFQPKIKPEYTDADLAEITAGIEHQKEPLRTFLKNSFMIARYQGCRLSETYFNPQTQITLADDPSQDLIRFHTKGDRELTCPLHPELRPLFQKLIADQATETYQKPPGSMYSGMSKAWARFLTRIGIKKRMPNACFHSLRVTAVSRLIRAGLPEVKTMKFIGHASTTVHRGYQRIPPTDLGDCLEALK